MNTKKLVLMALLVAVGAALYIVIPGINGGMKPDFMLTMMILGIILFPDAKSTFLLALTTGVLSGLFSTFPGGFVPNVIDKFITAFIIFAIVRFAAVKATKTLGTIATIAIGTMISGGIFLSIAMLILNFSGESTFLGLYAVVVLPAALLNSVAAFFIRPILVNLLERTSFKQSITS